MKLVTVHETAKGHVSADDPLLSAHVRMNVYLQLSVDNACFWAVPNALNG
jgi:hypothetical protein